MRVRHLPGLTGALLLLAILLTLNAPTAAAAQSCGEHVQTTLARYSNAGKSDQVSFRVTGNDLKRFFGVGNHGLVYIEVHDDRGSTERGPFNASSDTGFNAPITANYAAGYKKGLRISVKITGDNGSPVFCTGDYSVRVVVQAK